MTRVKKSTPLHVDPHYICHLDSAFRLGLPFLIPPYTQTNTHINCIQKQICSCTHTHWQANARLQTHLCSLTSLYDLPDDDFNPTWHLLKASRSVCHVHPNLTLYTVFELFPRGLSSAPRPPKTSPDSPQIVPL